MDEINAIGEKYSVKINLPQATGASFCDRLRLNGMKANVKKCIDAINDFTSKINVCHRQVVMSA